MSTSPHPLAAALSAPFASLGRAALHVLATIGGACLVFGRVVRALFPPRFDGHETWRQLFHVGVRSAPIVALTALFVGAIMVIQTAYFVRRTGATSLLGFGVGYSVFAEIGPVLIGLMFSGRVGANNTAELGTMVVTEQVDALRALAIDPVRYLVVPRFIAMMVMLTLLMVLGDLFAIVGAAITAQGVIGVDARVLVQSLVESHLLDELLMGIVKSATFGMAISCISCHFGLTVSGGAVGVGRATNHSVVANATAIFLLDFLVGWLFTL
ncbi:MAG: ABC transporter permease [Deltaproteobacteria bacterium]|jgi:phospholipid/cholesterol/gamma-HCH transport system permease protein|nr:ABC transporter permease [Deltaproteobacteria bacterium]